ncbi:hypothetical protein [Mycoplasma suis]|uniref:Uncharacterized protein n=1 Tax=Mycoplasma suis (strain Illinois) TaxID=768700 RepID=F0QRK4_MYCSL|nr:hypothetical protein [Mycoplasma suis]ADX98124.1 hypothetical protein MSU_0592 [Mycoplasma suis str. Illinois]
MRDNLNKYNSRTVNIKNSPEEERNKQLNEELYKIITSLDI